MRADMPDVIVTRGRAGYGYNPKGRREDLRNKFDEDAPLREKIRPPSVWVKERIQDHLAPLHRFLEQKIGQPWDDVYSEIRQSADHRSLLGNHLIEHVDGYVSYFYERYADVSQFVIDVNGILRKGHRWPRSRREPSLDPDIKPYDKDHECRRIHGLWFLITLSPLSDAPADAKDVVTNGIVRGYTIEFGDCKPAWKLVFWNDQALYPEKKLYASHKKQMNTKELVRAGLKSL